MLNTSYANLEEPVIFDLSGYRNKHTLKFLFLISDPGIFNIQSFICAYVNIQSIHMKTVPIHDSPMPIHKISNIASKTIQYSCHPREWTRLQLYSPVIVDYIQTELKYRANKSGTLQHGHT